MSDAYRSESLSWHKSTASAQGNCVEVANQDDAVHVRDSKEPAGAWLTFSASDWSVFLDGVRAGRFTA